ncbi:MAG: hypothetical protein IJM46_05785 [Oscillospiraceae bacterium]|nr:hypothetical protein [Oscillospiraceae bacterium]
MQQLICLRTLDQWSRARRGYIILCRKKQVERSVFYAAADLPENFRSMDAGTARRLDFYLRIVI